MEWPTDKQLKHVWDKIEGMDENKTMLISEHAKNKPELFIQCCKMWIDCFKDGEFTNDYKMFIKKKRFNIETYDKEEVMKKIHAFHDERFPPTKMKK